MSLKRPLFLTHRWLGIGLGVLFVLWFVSGVVMMYVSFPRLTEEERFAGLSPLELDSVRVGAQEALMLAGVEEPARRLRLTMVLGRPAYHILPWGGSWVTVFADTGERLAGLTPAQAVVIASRFHPGGAPAHDGLIDLDQWTVSSSLGAFRPLHRVRMNDSRGTELYVSALTGEVVWDTHRAERGWNWIGAIAHWIYLLPLRKHPELWRYSIIVLSTLGTILVLTGLATGVLRFRLRARYRNGRRSPYTGTLCWHHYLGLGCALFVFTWIVSGLLSVNPGKVFSSKSPDRQALLAWTGGGLELQRFTLAPVQAWRAATQKVAPRELEWNQVGGRPYYLFVAGPQASVAVPADGKPARALATIPEDDLARAVAMLLPGFRGELVLLEAEDAYYYSHHLRRRLPVLRVRFPDPPGTWFHIDPVTGVLLERLDRSNRIQRWLFNGLHSLDFAFLLRHRPAWDVLVIGLSLGGLILTLTGIVIGWRRVAGRKSSRESTPRSLVLSETWKWFVKPHTRRISFEQRYPDGFRNQKVDKGVRPVVLLAVATLHGVVLWGAWSYAPARATLETATTHVVQVSLVEPQSKTTPRVEKSTESKRGQPKSKPLPQLQPVKVPEPPPADMSVAKVPELPYIEMPPVPPRFVPPRFDVDYLSNPTPVYPALSRRLGEEGQVVLRVRVSEKGLPAQVEIAHSSGFERLDEAAVGTVWRWKFVPASRGETPVEAWVLIPITFILSRG